MVNPDRNLYEPPYDDALLYDSDLEPERPRSRPLVVLLGIVVLAAFAGVVWVAYNQGVKQGSLGGVTPVLTAETTRVSPQGDTSINVAPGKDYTQLPGMQSSEGDATIAPGPEEPRTMPSPQDIAANTAEKGVASGGTLGDRATDFDPPAVDPRMDSTTGPLSSSSKVEDITPQLPPVEMATPPVSAPPPTTIAPKTAKVTPPSAPPVPSAAVPTKSASAAPKVIAAPEATPAAPPPSETKMAALTPQPEAAAPVEKPTASAGGIQIQLGSFPSDALAASAWSRIKSSNQDLLGSYSPAFERAVIPNKGTWYRLRVGGFSDKTAAADVCEALKANGQPCIIAGK